MDDTPFKWPRWLLPVGDALLVTAAFLFSYYLRYEVQFLQPVDEANSAPFTPYWPYTLVFVVLILAFNHSAKLYRERRTRTWWDEVFAITNGATNAAVIVMALSFLLRPLVFSRLLIIQAAALVVLLLGAWRLALRIPARSSAQARHRRGARAHRRRGERGPVRVADAGRPPRPGL
ncbi:MAG: hypothetical protein KatS3mg051_0195 [Anaerolineae bacterium]|nr:MAG: hypothetical protein KatS3mg051_0195 [Anaerolineae bacterium]